MNKIKKIASSTGKFVDRHRVGIAIIATSAVWITVNRATFKEHDTFLKEHDLYEKFYTPQS